MIYSMPIININAIPIQKGLKTHHHDQSITLHSFRMIKVKPNKAGKPIPVLLAEDDSLLI